MGAAVGIHRNQGVDRRRTVARGPLAGLAVDVGDVIGGAVLLVVHALVEVARRALVTGDAGAGTAVGVEAPDVATRGQRAAGEGLLGGGGGDVGVAAQIARRVIRPHPVAVGGVGDQARVGEARACARRDLREVGAVARPLAALDAVAGDLHVVGRGGPGEADLAGAGGGGRQVARGGRGLGVASAPAAGGDGEAAATARAGAAGAAHGEVGGGAAGGGVGDRRARVAARGRARAAAAEAPRVGVPVRRSADAGDVGDGPVDAAAHADRGVGGVDGAGGLAQGRPGQRAADQHQADREVSGTASDGFPRGGGTIPAAEVRQRVCRWR